MSRSRRRISNSLSCSVGLLSWVICLGESCSITCCRSSSASFSPYPCCTSVSSTSVDIPFVEILLTHCFHVPVGSWSKSFFSNSCLFPLGVRPNCFKTSFNCTKRLPIRAKRVNHQVQTWNLEVLYSPMHSCNLRTQIPKSHFW